MDTTKTDNKPIRTSIVLVDKDDINPRVTAKRRARALRTRVRQAGYPSLSAMIRSFADFEVDIVRRA